MKVTFVRFNRLQKFDDGSTSDEQRATNSYPIDYNPTTLLVTVGSKSFPITTVVCLEYASPECPECKQEFQDNRALAAHRSFKHQVAGKARK